jgi:hypothetical protein
LLLSTLLAVDPSAPSADRAAASYVASRLWARLPSALDSITVAHVPTYPVAETLYALGLIGDAEPSFER